MTIVWFPTADLINTSETLGWEGWVCQLNHKKQTIAMKFLGLFSRSTGQGPDETGTHLEKLHRLTSLAKLRLGWRQRSRRCRGRSGRHAFLRFHFVICQRQKSHDFWFVSIFVQECLAVLTAISDQNHTEMLMKSILKILYRITLQNFVCYFCFVIVQEQKMDKNWGAGNTSIAIPVFEILSFKMCSKSMPGMLL